MILLFLALMDAASSNVDIPAWAYIVLTIWYVALFTARAVMSNN